MVEVPLLVLVYASVSSWLVETGDLLEYVGNISSFLSTHSVTLYGPNLSLCQMMSMAKKRGRQCKQGVLSRTNSGQVVGK